MNDLQIWWWSLDVLQQFVFVVIAMICTLSFLMGVANFIKDVLKIIFRKK